MSDLGNKEIFAKNLQYYMLLHKKDRNDICKDLGFAYTTFTSWYNAEFYPRIDKIEMLANYFNIEKSDLIEDKEKHGTNVQNNVIPLPDTPIRIPVLGKISAGLPILAVENIEGYEFAPSSQIKKGFDYFYLKVQGDSMNLKFNEGDIVLVQKQETLENSEIGVILVNGDDATVKKYRYENNMVILEPMSTNSLNTVQLYKPQKIKIVGKVVSYQGKI
ncbi:MAG: hypothetical protein LBL91_06100 [Lachnospiraceae bacterium]|jgi:repressor LexA|nr:hypothetical protein [Lachnospiraceae bacterium]